METEKTVEEIFVVASKVDGTDSTRLDRLNCLNALKVRLSSWLSVLHARKEGPSLMEMDLIVKDIEDRLESIKKDLERDQVRSLHHRKALGFPLRVGVGPRVIQASSPMLRLTLDTVRVEGVTVALAKPNPHQRAAVSIAASAAPSPTPAAAETHPQRPCSPS